MFIAGSSAKIMKIYIQQFEKINAGIRNLIRGRRGRKKKVTIITVRLSLLFFLLTKSL